MNMELFHSAMGFIDDDLIEEAARFRERAQHAARPHAVLPRTVWHRAAAMAACVCIAAGGIFVWSRYGQNVEMETTGATDGATPTMAVQETYGEAESGMAGVQLLDVRYSYGPMAYGDPEPDGVSLMMRSVVSESAIPSGKTHDTLCLKVTERGTRHKVEALVPAGEGAWELIVTRSVTDGGQNDVTVGRIYIDIPAGIVGADDTITIIWNEEK